MTGDFASQADGASIPTRATTTTFPSPLCVSSTTTHDQGGASQSSQPARPPALMHLHPASGCLLPMALHGSMAPWAPMGWMDGLVAECIMLAGRGALDSYHRLLVSGSLTQAAARHWSHRYPECPTTDSGLSRSSWPAWPPAWRAWVAGGQTPQHGIDLWRPAHCLSALSQRNSKTGLQVWDRRHRLSPSQGRWPWCPELFMRVSKGRRAATLRNIGPDCRGLGQGSPSLTHSDSLARHPDGADDTRLANLQPLARAMAHGPWPLANHIRVYRNYCVLP